MATARSVDPENQRALPPGPQGLPLLGNVLRFRRDQLAFLLNLQRSYGHMATISIGRTPVVLCFRPEHVRYILTQNPRNFTNREVAGGLIFGNLLVLSLLARSLTNKVVEGLQGFVGDGLLTTDGDFHDRHRRILQAGFSKRQVDKHDALIVEYTRETMSRLPIGTAIDITNEIQALVLRITAKVLLGRDLQNTDAGRIIDGLLAQPIGLLEGLLNLKIGLPFTPYSRRMALLREADDFIYAIIDRRSAENSDQGDILSILLAPREESEGGTLTRRQIRDELASLIAAGYETTTNTLAWTFYLLAQHPAVLEKVQRELQTVLAGRDPQAADLPHLTYLDRVVRESMRLYPSAWTQGRRAVEAFDLDGYRFPAGTLLMFSQWVLHRLPDIWGDPDVFRPERWDPAHAQEAQRRAYFPFGVGPRSCLGMSLAQLETRLVLATILQPLVPALVPGHPVRPLPLITLSLKHGLRLRMSPAPTQAVESAPGLRGTPSSPGCSHDGQLVAAERGY